MITDAEFWRLLMIVGGIVAVFATIQGALVIASMLEEWFDDVWPE
jgi:hypothetical protein